MTGAKIVDDLDRMYHQRTGLLKIACLKSALIDLEVRQDDKAEGECHRERLRRVDTYGEAIVRSATINKIAEVGRNDQSTRMRDNSMDTSRSRGFWLNSRIIRPLSFAQMVLAWVSERLAVAMRQAEDRDNVLDKSDLIDLELLKKDNKGQGLDDLAMWNRTNSGIKFLDFGDTIFTQDLLVSGNLSTTTPQIHGEGFAKFNDKFTMSFLNNQIWQDLATNVQKSVSSYNPFIAIALKKLIACFFKCSRTCASKCLLKPFKKALVRIADFKNTTIMTVFITIAWFVFQLTRMKAALAVYNSSKICKMKWIVVFRDVLKSVFMVNIVKFRHIFSMFTPISIHMKSYLIQAERLSG